MKYRPCAGSGRSIAARVRASPGPARASRAIGWRPVRPQPQPQSRPKSRSRPSSISHRCRRSRRSRRSRPRSRSGFAVMNNLPPLRPAAMLSPGLHLRLAPWSSPRSGKPTPSATRPPDIPMWPWLRIGTMIPVTPTSVGCPAARCGSGCSGRKSRTSSTATVMRPTMMLSRRRASRSCGPMRRTSGSRQVRGQGSSRSTSPSRIQRRRKIVRVPSTAFCGH